MRIFKQFDDMDELKSVAYSPTSNPYVESIIGKIRLEYTNNLLFFGREDLVVKLAEFRRYYNEARVHSQISFNTPSEKASDAPLATVNLGNVRWNSYCHGLYNIPIAA